MTSGNTKIHAIPYVSLNIPENQSRESQVIYLLKIKKFVDHYGTSSSNLAALLHTKPGVVEDICTSSNRIERIGRLKKLGVSTWKLKEKGKSEK